ncbi:MAG: hypothetical protein ACREV1_00660 [Gammaproteobacteria bacterium]
MIETSTYTFVPDLKVVGRTEPVVSTRAIIDEPMIWGADLNFTRRHGGPLTRMALQLLEGELPMIQQIERRGRYACIDTESQFLLIGQFPSIPGWHGDAMLETDNGQPDFSTISPDALVYMLSISDQPGGVSRTLLAAQPLTVEYDRDHVWRSVHRAAETFLLQRVLAEEGTMIRLDQDTLHKPAPCYRKGWRFWFRLTLYHKPPKNEFLNRVQVYSPEEPW